MKTTSAGVLTTMTCALVTATSPVRAADVTFERLQNPEPQNWLMNHRTYDAQRYSPLARISKDNVKNLKLAYAVPIGGTVYWLTFNPDGKVSVVVMNRGDQPVSYFLWLDGKAAEVSSLPHSIQTLVF